MNRVPQRATSSNGASYPGAETSPLAAMFIEMLLTFGLASVVLGTASGAESVGVFAALGVGGYVTAVQRI
jgi:aquaporin Z